MAETTTATPKKRAPAKRKPATRHATASRPLVERAVLIPVGVVEGLVTQVGKTLDLDVESLTSRVEKVVQDGVDAGMKLVNGVQERLPKVV
jgi:hypothetical protein